MKKKIYSITILIVLLFAVGSSSAQQNDAIAPITVKGSAGALLFVQGMAPFQVSTFGVSGKYFLADAFALRGGVSFNTRSYADSLSSTGFGINVGFEAHTRPVYAISPYWGASVGFDMGKITDTTAGAIILASKKGGVNSQATDPVIATTSTTSFGVSALAGFDWFIFKNIALGSELSFGISTTSSSTTLGSTTVDNPASTYLGFSSMGSVHVLIYF